VVGSGGVDMSGGGFSGDGGQATAALLKYPFDVKIDGSNNMYIADCGNSRIRHVNLLNGIISTVVGGGSQGFGGDGQAATSSETMLNNPYALALDSENTIYIADGQNHRIRKVQNAVITTIAGTTGGGYNGDGIQATSAQLYVPVDMALDSAEEYMLIAENSNNRVRKVVFATGVITTIAGNGGVDFTSFGDGVAATSVSIRGPRGVALDGLGNVYITEREYCRIHKIDVTSGLMTTIAGTGGIGFNGDSISATSAYLFYPSNIVVDSGYNVFFTDAENHRVRKITASTGIITTIAGTGSATFG